MDTDNTEQQRQQTIVRIEKQLEKRSYPRLQMMLIVSLTGAAGLLSSVTLLRLGVLNMAARYPVSVLMAYAVFLGLLGLWIRHLAADYNNLTPAQQAAEEADSAGPPATAPPVANTADPVGSLGAVRGLSAQEAQVRFSVMDKVLRLLRFVSDLVSNFVEGIFRGIGKLLGDGDELMIPIMVALLFLGMGLASLYVVATAPALMAELLVDSTLSYSLYKRLVRTEERNWLRAAITRTLWPLALTTVFVTLMGAALGFMAPGAHTIGQALAYTPPVAEAAPAP